MQFTARRASAFPLNITLGRPLSFAVARSRHTRAIRPLPMDMHPMKLVPS